MCTGSVAVGTTMLSKKVSVCDLIDKLDETQCLDVIRLWQDELDCKNLNELLIKLIIRTKDMFTIKSLDNIKKNIQQIIENKPKLKSPKPVKKNDNNQMKPEIFPLLRLPIDLITNSCLFLNEDEIFQFEKCCRLFYQMVNNTSYLSKCNDYNFQTFEITQKRLQEMIKPEYSFFKYSQAKVLKFDMLNFFYAYDKLNIGDDAALQILLDIYLPMWEQAQRDCNWLTSLMKSVKLIQLGTFSTLFLPKLAIDILFNPDESQLEGIELDHFLEQDKRWKHWMNEFEEKYLNLRNKLQAQGKKIQTLDFINHNNNEHVDLVRVSGPRYVAAKCRLVSWVTLDATGKNAMYLNNDICPALKMMTIRNDIAILNHNSLDTRKNKRNTTNQVNVNNQSLGIETLRIILFRLNENTILLNDKNVIESLNLHNSLKNLTLELEIAANTKKWFVALRDILRKEYYYNLENVNILIEDISETQFITFFKILKENKHILQYQFKQLNIGFRIATRHLHHYDVLMWNHKMNDKFLNKKMDSILHVIKCIQRKGVVPVSVKSPEEAKQNYYTWRMQWVKRYDYLPLSPSYD